MNKRNLVVFLILMIAAQIHSLQLASITWEQFEQKAKVLAMARIIKTERVNYETVVTYELEEIYKGPKVKTVTITLDRMMDGYPTTLNQTGVIALSKKKGSWQFAADGRSFWPVEYISKPDHYTFTVIRISDYLVRDFPVKKKKRKVIVRLHDGTYYEHEAEFYLKEDVEKFLVQQWK